MNDEQNVAYPYNGILFGNKKHCSTDTHCDMGEPWKHSAKESSQSQKAIYYKISFIWKKIEWQKVY